MEISGWDRLEPAAMPRFAIRIASKLASNDQTGGRDIRLLMDAKEELRAEAARFSYTLGAVVSAATAVQSTLTKVDSKVGMVGRSQSKVVRKRLAEDLKSELARARDGLYQVQTQTQTLESYRGRCRGCRDSVLNTLNTLLESSAVNASASPLTARGLLAQLRALHACFKGGVWVRKRRKACTDQTGWSQLGVIMGPVVFPECYLDLGRFLVWYDLLDVEDVDHFRAVALTPVLHHEKPYLTHPFVSEGTICLGHGQAPVINCRRAGLVLPVFQTIWSILRECSSTASPYARPSTWRGPDFTCACKRTAPVSSATSCLGCRAQMCAECVKTQMSRADCALCAREDDLKWRPACASCLRTCEACSSQLCDLHMPQCSYCTNSSCLLCQEDKAPSTDDNAYKTCHVCNQCNICPRCTGGTGGRSVTCVTCSENVCFQCSSACSGCRGGPVCGTRVCVTCYNAAPADHTVCGTCRAYVCEDHIENLACEHTCACRGCILRLANGEFSCGACSGSCEGCGEYYFYSEFDDDGYCEDCQTCSCERCDRSFERDELNEDGHCEECRDRCCRRCEEWFPPDDLNGDGHCRECRDRECAGCSGDFAPSDLNVDDRCEDCVLTACSRCGSMVRREDLDDGRCENCEDVACDDCGLTVDPNEIDGDGRCARCAILVGTEEEATS